MSAPQIRRLTQSKLNFTTQLANSFKRSYSPSRLSISALVSKGQFL